MNDYITTTRPRSKRPRRHITGIKSLGQKKGGPKPSAYYLMFFHFMLLLFVSFAFLMLSAVTHHQLSDDDTSTNVPSNNRLRTLQITETAISKDASVTSWLFHKSSSIKPKNITILFSFIHPPIKKGAEAPSWLVKV